MSVHSIGELMTPVAYSVAEDQSVVDAALRMKELSVRHLPVMRGSKLVGIVSHRDLAILEAIVNVHSLNLSVQAAMTPEPYTAHPHTSVIEVAGVMADHKYGAVVVVEDEEVKGIFTTTDALRVLAELERERP